ncbi:MAG: hypothetical protein FJ095_00245 [Deltaproteobacteria bacterium]|nr:hypothetical protein [Deltaproteobacteria bacterium]
MELRKASPLRPSHRSSTAALAAWFVVTTTACVGGRSEFMTLVDGAPLDASVGDSTNSSAAPRGGSRPAVSAGAGGAESGPSDSVLFVNGQSNATTFEFPEAGIYDSADLLTWEGEGWVTAKVGLPGHVGAGVGALAGRTMRGILGSSEVPGRVDNHGWPGQALSYFLPASSDVAMVAGDVDSSGRNNYRLARDSWTASGAEPTVVLWAQGEADGEASAAEYGASLETLVAAWWHDYPKLERIVIVQTAEGACGRRTDGVRAAQATVAAVDPRVRLVLVDDLTRDPAYHDGCHYTLAGYERLADRAVLALGLLTL